MHYHCGVVCVHCQLVMCLTTLRCLTSYRSEPQRIVRRLCRTYYIWASSDGLLPKQNVVGSNPITRSLVCPHLVATTCCRPPFHAPTLRSAPTGPIRDRSASENLFDTVGGAPPGRLATPSFLRPAQRGAPNSPAQSSTGACLVCVSSSGVKGSASLALHGRYSTSRGRVPGAAAQ